MTATRNVFYVSVTVDECQGNFTVSVEPGVSGANIPFEQRRDGEILGNFAGVGGEVRRLLNPVEPPHGVTESWADRARRGWIAGNWGTLVHAATDRESAESLAAETAEAIRAAGVRCVY
jgi:hypothetical protein